MTRARPWFTQLLALIWIYVVFIPASWADNAEIRLARIERDQQMAKGELARDLILPDRFDDLKLLLPQLQSVVRGTVTDISYDYLDCEGPRTVVTLNRVESLLGGEVDSEVQLRIFGGPLPNGKYVEASELPRFVSDATYVLLLRNTDWRFAPVMGDFAFREETIFDRPVLIDSDGFAMTAVSDTGIERNTEQITKAVGQAIVGVEGGRETTNQPSESGEIRACKSGQQCTFEIEPGEKDRDALSTTKDPTNRFARPELVKGVVPENLGPAISTDELISQLKRFAFELGIELGGTFQPETRLGCWNVTITDPWR